MINAKVASSLLAAAIKFVSDIYFRNTLDPIHLRRFPPEARRLCRLLSGSRQVLVSSAQFSAVPKNSANGISIAEPDTYNQAREAP
jgi:hypothetical protein